MLEKEALDLHKKHKGKLSVASKIKLNKKNLSLAYTPGVATVSKEILRNKKSIYDYTMKNNSVAVVTDGSAVLGLGNIGAEAALPVMEGKAILFKEFADIDAFPICLKTQKTDEIISIIKNIAPVFGGINLEDINAPRCFEIEEKLQNIGIPVFHDDQHGTAIVVLAALLNSAKVIKKEFSSLKVVVNGAGPAGVAISRLLACSDYKSKICKSVGDILVLDSHGAIYRGRKNLPPFKKNLSKITNKENFKGNLKDAIKNADVFIGVSRPELLKPSMIKLMNKNPIVFALANPIPEIMPSLALKAGAKIIATGRSDFPNQVNNVLVFPGIFRGALNARIEKITERMKIHAAHALASTVKNPTPSKILPSIFDKSIVRVIARAVEDCKNKG